MTQRNSAGEKSDVNAVKHTMPDNSAKSIKSHLDHMRRQNLAPTTIRQRGAALRRLATWLTSESDCALLDATRHDLVAWQSGLTVSMSAIATYTSHVTAFYAWALDLELIEVDPAARLPRPKVPDRLPRPIPAADLQLALTCALGRVQMWILLGVLMGLRAAEVAGIRREDIAEVVVGGQTRWLLSGIGKGNRPFRLPVPSALVPVLRTHMAGRPGALWLTTSGEPVKSQNVTDEVTALFRSLGMHYTHHCCRHTFGTLLHRETHDLLLVAERMRHRSTKTTQGYVEPVDGEATEAMDRIADAQLGRDDRRAS